MRLLTKVLSILIIGSVMSCKSTKAVSNSGEVSSSLSVKKIIKAHVKASATFKTLQSKVKISFTQGSKTKGYTVTLRIDKDKTIWLNATLGLARAKITPENVQFYDKINNQYFDGDFSLLSNLLGTDIDYFKLEKLLLGESVFKLKKSDFAASIHEKSYMLAPKEQQELFEVFLLFNPTHFKMDSQQIAQAENNRFLEVDYLAYQKVKTQTLPKNIKIIAVESDEETIIELEYKSVKLNEPFRFPFRIPSGFEEIILK
jgi:hypothetical protein